METKTDVQVRNLSFFQGKIMIANLVVRESTDGSTLGNRATMQVVKRTNDQHPGQKYEGSKYSGSFLSLPPLW